jgi:ATP-dependent 26S proteasome regulatory subunit
VIVVNVSELSSAREIAPAYLLAAEIAPAMVVLEDIDQLSLKNKTSRCLGMLIELLDSTKLLEAVITVMTLNEPQKVHPSLMDRRGRIDRILRFGPPKTPPEIEEVLTVWTRKLCESELPLLDEEFYAELLSHGLNHADIKELVSQCKIRNDSVTAEGLKTAFRCLQKSRDDLRDFIEMQRKGDNTYEGLEEILEEIVDDKAPSRSHR